MRTVLTGYLKPEEKRENYTRWYQYNWCCHTSIKRLEIFLTVTTLLGTYVHALQLTSYYLYPHLLSAAVTMQTWAAHPIERERERERERVRALWARWGLAGTCATLTRVWWSCRTGSWSCWRRWSASWPCGWRAIRNMHRSCSTSVSRWTSMTTPLRSTTSVRSPR